MNKIVTTSPGHYTVFNAEGVCIARAYFCRWWSKFGPQTDARVIYADGSKENTGHCYAKDFKRFLETI